MKDLRARVTDLVLAHVADATRGMENTGPRRPCDELLAELAAHAERDGSARLRAYAHAVHVAYERFGAKRVFKTLAPRAWSILCSPDARRAAGPVYAERIVREAGEAFAATWAPLAEEFEHRALDPAYMPAPARAPARPAAPAPSPTPVRPPTARERAVPRRDDKPWWTGWGDAEFADWLEQVRRDAHCEVVWCPERKRGRPVPLRVYVPPWVLSDLYQFGADIERHLVTRSRKAA